MMTDDCPTLTEPEAPRVLLVDDHRDVRSMIAKYLAFNGFAVTEAGNGREALEALNSGTFFRYLLTDLSLPDLDGRDVARLVRQSSPTTWTAIITGWTLEPDEYLPWGVDRVFSKPVDLADLSRALGESPTPVEVSR
jgi:two-component system OmpR family response regulator